MRGQEDATVRGCGDKMLSLGEAGWGWWLTCKADVSAQWTPFKLEKMYCKLLASVIKCHWCDSCGPNL